MVTINERFFRGKKYRSAFEGRIARDLTERGVPFKYEAKQIFYSQPSSYVTDFSLPLGVLVEVKGYLRPTDRRKLLEVKRQYPELDIRLVFQRARNKLSGASSKGLTYGQWATRHGFLWAEGTIPDEWILDPAEGKDVDDP